MDINLSKNNLKIKKNQLEMVRDRNYNIDDSDGFILDFTNEEYINYIQEKTNELKSTESAILSSIYYNNDKSDAVFVYYAPIIENNTFIRMNVITEFLNLIKNYNVQKGIFIMPIGFEKLSPSSNKDLKNSQYKYDIEIFKFRELLINPNKHVFSRKMTKIPDSEVEEKLKELKCKKNNLTSITKNDPIVKWYGWSINSVVKIERCDDMIPLTSSLTYGYRLIIDD